MRNLLSSLLFGVLFLGLAAFAFFSAPRSENASASAVPAIDTTTNLTAETTTNNSTASQATFNYNLVGLPLDVTQSFTDLGYTMDGEGLADYVNSTSSGGDAVDQVIRWNASTGLYETWFAKFGFGDVFPLEVGGAYYVLVDSTADTVLTFVGDVPPLGSVNFTLVPAAAAGCNYNFITIPLDRDDITTAEELADDIDEATVDQVLEWDASTQNYKTWFAKFDFGDTINVKIGYPYLVCIDNGGPTSWP